MLPPDVAPPIRRHFRAEYKCFSVAMLPGNDRDDVERGGKIIMPPAALAHLTSLNIAYPMLFRLTNKKSNRVTHCGVLEFVADDGKVYLPYWMMKNLHLDESDIVNIKNVSLPVATFSRFQPQSVDFLDITNPKAVLENSLRGFACLTSGDVIALQYNERVYEMCVLETRPGPAVTIIECDMNVDFAPPVGYKDPSEVGKEEDIDPADMMPEATGFIAFRGEGNRLDGKERKDSGPSEEDVQKPVYVRGIPDYDHKIGTIKFMRNVKPVDDKKEKITEEFKAFTGEGFSLRKRKN